MSEPAGFRSHCSLVLVWLAGRLFRSHATPYPPGPRGLPILGNAVEIPPERNWLKFAEWAKDYGMLYISQRSVITSSSSAPRRLSTSCSLNAAQITLIGRS
ncbi:hypothetical protein BKA62DRAFT_714915 [Auriculariales sp. MPI-PUGE-AT-0066]|nr:hypothetical protein BKA62DRAFT_714915 [Auriculariales sp. MPI-PUGE-AT-0066]